MQLIVLTPRPNGCILKLATRSICKGDDDMDDVPRARDRNATYHIGEIYLMNFSGVQSEQSGLRPGLVFQNNTGNYYSPNIIALPLTTSIKKRCQPTHVLISSSNSGLKRDSIILCENPERMSKEKIGRYITKLSYEQMSEVAAASLLASSYISYLNPDDLIVLWKKAVSLNGDTQMYSA